MRAEGDTAQVACSRSWSGATQQRCRGASTDHIASVDTYARLIRAWLMLREGRVEVPWKESMDSWDVRSLDTEIAEAVRRRKATQSIRQAPGKVATRRQR